MTFRSDRDAAAARVTALEQRVRELEAQLAERDAQLSEVQLRVERLDKLLGQGDSEALARERELATLRKELARARGKAPPPEPAPASRKRKAPRGDADPSHPLYGRAAPVSDADRRKVAEQLLAYGVVKHREGERAEAAAAFARGLELVPGHSGLLRAQKRYS
ncbi:MAG: hypothetical protein IT370_36870 [Deltaproteobacteria bacterium]|nr:hypothetical protein [Deltaproteobacteria bacterium]